MTNSVDRIRYPHTSKDSWEKLGFSSESDLRLAIMMFTVKDVHYQTALVGSEKLVCFASEIIPILEGWSKRQSPFGKEAPVKIEKTERDGEVYFILDKARKCIKIGFSKNPEKRLKSLQTGSGSKLSLLKTVSGTYSLESKYKRQFASLKIQGEWYKATKELQDFIDSL